VSRGGPGKLRPHIWIVGTDTYKHDMYHPWQAHRAQAKFRGEEYTLEFEDFYEFWTGSWHERGRGGDDMILTRIDPEKPWQADNCKLRVRKEYLSEINKGKAGLGIRRTRGMDIHKRKTKGT
jgi:hypothetical protein